MLQTKSRRRRKMSQNKRPAAARLASNSSELSVRWFRPALELLEDRRLLAITLQGIPDYVQQGPGPITGGQADVNDNQVAGAINAVVPVDANHLLVGTVNGGIWRTANATADHPEWAPLTDQYPSLSINSLVSGGGAIYAGLGDSSSGSFDGGARTGILRSTDGGDSWQQFGELPPVVPLVVNPIGGGAKGGLLAAGVYQAEFTFTNAGGESTSSLETAPFTVAAGNLPSLAVPALPAGVTGINVYLTPAGGASGSEVGYAAYSVGGKLTLGTAASAFGFPPPATSTLKVPVGRAPDPALGGLGTMDVQRIIPTTLETDGTPNTQIVLAGTGQGVFLSQDGGQTWSNESARTGSGLPTGVGVSDLVLAASDTGGGDVLYAAIPGQGVYSAVLAKGGEILNPFTGHFYPVIPTQGQLPLTWTNVSAGLTGQATPYKLNTVPVLTNVTQTSWIDLAVHDSTDGDVIWAALVQPTSGTLRGNQFVGIFASTTGAANTWVSWGLPSDSDGPVDPTGETGSGNGAIVADQESGDVVGGGPVLYIGGDGEAGNNHEGKVFRATAANQWQGITGDQEAPIDTDFGKPHADTRGLFMSGQYLYAATDGGIYQLNNARLDPNLAANDDDTPLWKSLNGNMFITELYQVAAFSGGLIGAAQDNGVDYQPGSGQLEWIQTSTGDGWQVQGAGDIAYYMTNGGMYTWNGTGNSSVDLEVVAQGDTPLQNVDPNAGFGGTNKPLFVVDAVEPKRLLFGTGILYESLDNGDSLNNLGPIGPAAPDNDAPVAAGGDGGAYDAFEYSPITAMAYGGSLNGQNNAGVAWVAASNVLQVRKQDGDTFKPIAFPGASIKAITLDPTDCQIAYLIDTNGTVWKTPDDGATWQNLTGNLANFSTDLRTIAVAKGSPDVLLVGAGKEVVSPTTGVPAAGSGGIYRLINPDTAAGVPVWTRYGRNLPNAPVTDLHVIGSGILVGTFGRGAYILPSASDSLTVPGVITVNGDDDPTQPNDNIVLSLDANNPLLLDVTLNGAAPVQVPATAVSQINVNGKTGADTLTVDFRNGVFSPPAGITFDGGSDPATPGDTLVGIAQNGTTSTAKYNPSNGGNGDLLVDGVKLHYQNLTPILVSNVNDFTLTTPNSGNILTLDTPGAAQLRLSGLSGGVAFENVTVSSVRHVIVDTATNDFSGADDTITTTAAALLAVPSTDFTLHTGPNTAGNVFNLDAQGHDVTITQNTIKVAGAQALFFDTLGTINLTNAGNVAVDGSAASDSLVVNANSPTAGSLRLNNGPLVVLDTLSSLAFVGNGVDSLVIHNPAGTIFAPSGGIQFESDAGAGFLTLDGGGDPAFVETDDNGPAAWAANIVFAGPVSTAIRLSGVLHISDTVPVGQLAITATDAANAITLDDGAAPGDGLIRATIDNFPIIEFGAKTALALNGGLSRANLGDTIYINYHELPTGLTAVTVDSGAGDGVVYVIASPLVATEIDTGYGHDLIAVQPDLTVPLTIVGGIGTDTIYGGAGNDITVRSANLIIDESAASVASILTLTDSLISGWELPAAGLSPVVHVDALNSLTIEAAAGDRFDLEGGIAPSIINASTTRDAVYDMGTGGILDGDFSLFMGWRLLHDGTITKPETLQSLNATMIVNFSSASDAATQVVFDGNLDPAGAAYTIGNDRIGNLLFANQTVGLTVEINGYRDQDQVTIDLPGGSVNADLRHTGPATIYLDGTVRLAGTNPTAANQFTVQARSGAVTMLPDGDNNSVFSLFDTLYVLGSMPQDSLNLTQPTNFKVAPTAARPAAASYEMELDNPAGWVAGYANEYLQEDPPSGWVYNLHSPAPVLVRDPQVPDNDRLTSFDNIEVSPTTILDAAPLDYLGDNVDYSDQPLTYVGSGTVLRHLDGLPPDTGYYTEGPLTYGQLTVWVRILTVTSHPVPIDNAVNLDASQLRGAFNYTAADPDYAKLSQFYELFGASSLAFGKTSVNLTNVNPQLAVTITGQDPLVQAGYTFPGANEPQVFNDLADNRIPTTSVNVGGGILADIQGNVTVQLAQLTVDDGQGSLAGVLTLTDTSLTGWATALGTTQPTLFFATYMHDDLAASIAHAMDPFLSVSQAVLEYPDVLFNLYDDFVITGSPVDQFDVENTPTTGSDVVDNGSYTWGFPYNNDYSNFHVVANPANQTLIQNRATSGTPAGVYVMGKALPRLHVMGNFALTIGRRLHADGTVDNVGLVENVFYGEGPVTFDYTGVGQGPLVVDLSNETVTTGEAYSGRFVTGMYANVDKPGYGYLKTDFGYQGNGLPGGDILFYGPNTELSYLAPSDLNLIAHPFSIDNTIAATVHYVANPVNQYGYVTQIQIGAAFGPVDVQGNGAVTRVNIDPTYYVNNGVAGSNLRDTITADVSVSTATLQIVADAAGASPPQNPPIVVLTDTALTGVATGTIHFHNLVNGVDLLNYQNANVAGFGLALQLPRGGVSTVVQNTPSGTTTQISTADTAGPVLVTGTTGKLWLGRTLSVLYYSQQTVQYSVVEGAFSASSVTIGGGSLQGIAGPIALDYSSAVPTTIDDHADSTPTQGVFSTGPAAVADGYTLVEYYPYELIAANPIYFGGAFKSTAPSALSVLGAAQSHFTVSANPLGTKLFAGVGSTVDVTAAYNNPPLDILGAAAVHFLWQNYNVGAITVEADPARLLDPTNLTVTYLDYDSPSAITVGGADQRLDVITAGFGGGYLAPEQIFYEAATTHLTVSGGINSPVTVTDTGAGGTTIGPGYTHVYVQGTTGPLQATAGPTTHLALGNAGNMQALDGEIDILANSSPLPALPVVLDDSADTLARTVAVSADESGNEVISGLAPAAIRIDGVPTDITSGTGGDSYQLLNVPAAILTITGNGVSDSLHGTAAGPNIWQFTGPASGILDGTVYYTGIPNPTFVAVPLDPGSQTSFDQQTIHLPIQTSGGDGQPLSFTASGLPNGLSIDSLTGVISGKIQVSQAATYTVGVDVADGVNVASAQFSWSVTIDVTPPTVSLMVSVKGTQPTFSATATDNPGGSGLASVQFQYSADGGVTWIDAGPAETAAPVTYLLPTFTYTLPTALSDGTYLARAIATDNVGNRAVSAPSLATLATFDGANGSRPSAGLILDGSGNLYGTTPSGGANNDGTVFELDPTTGMLSTLATFDGTNGAQPYDAEQFQRHGHDRLCPGGLNAHCRDAHGACGGHRGRPSRHDADRRRDAAGRRQFAPDRRDYRCKHHGFSIHRRRFSPALVV